MSVTIVLMESDFRALFASVPIGSASYACLEAAGEHGRIAGIRNMHDQVAVTCPVNIAQALLAVARAACPGIVPNIRKAIKAPTTSPSE
jgi:hypothetical protein